MAVAVNVQRAAATRVPPLMLRGIWCQRLDDAQLGVRPIFNAKRVLTGKSSIISCPS